MTEESSKNSRAAPPKPPGADEGDTIVHEEERTLVRVTKPETPEEKVDAFADQARLVVLSGPLPDRSYLLDLSEEGSFILGRDPACALVLDDGSISRRHAEIFRRGKVHFLRDLGSSNGTLVNDQLMSGEMALRNQSQIRLGIYLFAFLDPHLQEEDLPKPPAPSPSEAVQAPVAEDVLKMPIAKKHLWIGFATLAIVTLLLLIRGIHQISREEKLSFGQTLIKLLGGEGAPKLVTPYMEIRTSPIPGKIYFQGEYLGTGTVDVQMTQQFVPGDHYELRADFDLTEVEEKVTLTETVRFTENQTTFSALLEAPIGQIHVLKVPRNVQVLLEFVRADEKKPNEEPKIRFRPLKVEYKEPFYAPFGDYKLELRRNETFLYRRRFVLAEANMRAAFAIQEEDLTFTPISITSTPAGADIFLDGVLLKSPTPLKDFALPFGHHTILLRKENFEDFVLTDLPNPVQVNEPLVFDVVLPISEVSEMIVRAKNTFESTSWEEIVQLLVKAQRHLPPPTPHENAEIQLWLGKAYLKGSNLEQALRNFRLAQAYTDDQGKKPFLDAGSLGEGEIAHLRGDRVKALRLAVEVFFHAQEESLKTVAEDLFIKLSPARAAIRLTTTPEGATVWLNSEKQHAQTPLILADLPLGAINLLVTKKGYRDHKELVRLGLHDLKGIHVKLEPQ